MGQNTVKQIQQLAPMLVERLNLLYIKLDGRHFLALERNSSSTS